MKKPTAAQAIAALKKYKSPGRAKTNAWFFKTKPGQYGHGDKFWGVTVPQTRLVAKQFASLPLSEVVGANSCSPLLGNPVHEVRLLGALILTEQFKKADTIIKKKIFDLYIKNAPRFNNWDLVDLSASYIVGQHLYDTVGANGCSPLLKKLAHSKNLWERRIAIIGTFYFIRQGNPKPTFAITKLLITDSHDLIHKACGWMLREVGKNCGEATLKKFLTQNIKKLPRTTLRYAIERFPVAERKRFLAK